MTQEEIWENHLKNTTLSDVINEYNHPAIFQKELVDVINKYTEQEKKIIEVGCELGVTSMLLDDSFNKTLLDLNPLAIELTKQAHHSLNKKAQFIIADMFSMPIENSQYDIVFNAGVIEHFDLAARAKALMEYSRILKENGVMLIAFPNHYSFPYRLAYKIRTLLNRWPYPTEYKLYDLKNEIAAANLVLEKRIVLSKKSVMNWLSFALPLKYFFQFLDLFLNYEGYLTVLIIRKKS